MNQKAAPTEERRQGTEPSRRFLVDLNTGLLKEYISEMDRRAEVYIPTYKSEFRQGTQNSRVTLVNTRTGQQLPQLSEMQRRAEPLSEFRQGTEYSEAALMKLRNDQIMERMEFRQGTENSRVTLVNIKTGQKLPRLSEMQRRAEPLSEFRQGTEYSEAALIELRKAQIMKTKEEAKVETIHQAVLPELRRQGTEPSRHVLVEPNTGLVKEQVNEMERSVSGLKRMKSEVGHNRVRAYVRACCVCGNTDNMESNNGESHSDQGTGINIDATQAEAMSTVTGDVKKKKRKKKKKHKHGEKGKKFDSQSGSSSESESESEIKPVCETAKALSGKVAQDLPDIIPKLETASDKHKEREKSQRSSSRSRTSRQDKSKRRQRSNSSSGKQRTRCRSRSRSARRSSRTRSKSLSRRESVQKRRRSRSRSGSRQRNRRSRSISARRGRRSRSRSRSRQHRSRSYVRKSRRSRSKSRSCSQLSRRSRSQRQERHSMSSSRSKSRSHDQPPESETQISTAAEIRHEDKSSPIINLSHAENGDEEKSQIEPVNPSDGVINDGQGARFAGSWKPIPFLDVGVTVVGSSETTTTAKCITPTMPLDINDVSENTLAEDLHSTENKEVITLVEQKDSQIFKQKSISPNRKRSKSSSRERSTSSSSLKQRKSRSSSRNSRKSPLQKKRSRSRKRARRSKSKSPKRKRSKSHSPRRRRRSRTSERNRSKSRHRSRSNSRRSRSGSRRKRGGFRSRMFSQRDRWKREPSHSPVVILRKKGLTSRNQRSASQTPPRLTELDKEQLLEIAKANAAAMCAKAGMPIPESLRPKAIFQLPLPNPNSTSLPLPLPLPVNLPMGLQGMSSMTMNAAMASMTAATMTAALSGMNTLAAMPQMAPLPTITNKPPPSSAPNLNMVNIEEAKKKLAKQANSYSIKELTEKCKKIAESKEEMAVAKPHVSDDEDDRPFGGVALKENKGITFSLSNPSVKPAVRSEAAFAKEFPVSSGSQHRKKEEDGVYGEWVPVDKKTEKAGAPSASAEAEDQSKAKDSVFPEAPTQPVDITLAISERAVAQKRLAENPFDINAMCMLNRAQEQVDAWAQSNTIPGLFTGSTGAQVLSSEELSNSGPQAWIKKDQFLRAAPVSGGMGELLMKKMGWRAGEGLGKHREGTVEPILIDFKTDRKGLVAEGEKTQKSGNLVMMKDLLGKHPVSALMELCNKKKWQQPEFIMVLHSGPDHRKNFLFKVVVNGCEYQPQTASPNKKHAKAMAATVALQAMGEIAGDSVHSGPQFTAATST
ncbi:protein SON [Silurus meridionalis]|nr:protein SON [Silurus meridionalis]